MMEKKLLFFVMLIIFTCIFCACENEETTKDSQSKNGPELMLVDEKELYENLNAGDKVNIPLKAHSQLGVKKIGYFFTMKTENGTETTDVISLPMSDELQKTVETSIVFTADAKYMNMYIVAYDSDNNSSEKLVLFENVRAKAVMSFADNIDFVEAAFEGKKLPITGHISSEHEIIRFSYKEVINGIDKAIVQLPLGDKKEIDFSFDINVVKGLRKICMEVENKYNGVTRDTFKIMDVLDDAIVIALNDNVSELTTMFEGEDNLISGSLSSGTDLSSLKYAVKANGVYGPEKDINIGTSVAEYKFSVSIYGTPMMEEIKFIATNEGGKTAEKIVPVSKMQIRLIYMQDVVMTTEIGAGKKNWFACYKEPYLFDQTTAATASEMMDFVFTVHSNKLAILSANIIDVAGYDKTLQPYMAGFADVTYTLITGNRAQIKPASFDELSTVEQFDAFIENQIIVAGKYGLKTTNRGLNTGLTVNGGFVIGWGAQSDKTVTPLVVANKQFGLIIVKELNLTGGVGTIKFDIKFPKKDARTAYNPESIRSYIPGN